MYHPLFVVPHPLRAVLSLHAPASVHTPCHAANQSASLRSDGEGALVTRLPSHPCSCGMVDAMLICGIEAIILMAQAYYVEQVRCALYI